jgi:glucose-induced degradation protein 4
VLVVVYLQDVLYFQAFSGTQNVSSLQKDEAWRVNVRIQGCDLEHGYLCGSMEALNVPMADTPVSNFSIVHFS